MRLHMATEMQVEVGVRFLISISLPTPVKYSGDGEGGGQKNVLCSAYLSWGIYRSLHHDRLDLLSERQSGG